jgi:hypothetical protein
MFNEFFEALKNNNFEEMPVDAKTFVEGEAYLNQPPLSDIQYDIVEAMSQIYREEDLVDIMGAEEGHRYYKKYTKNDIMKNSPLYIIYTRACKYLSENEVKELSDKLSKGTGKQGRMFLRIFLQNFDIEVFKDKPLIPEDIWLYNYIKYEITESVLPVREYGATLKVEAAGDNKTIVTWRAMFKRQDPANPGAAGKDDAAAKAAISGIFKSGLENIKKISE